jgi:hypothetical protein
VADASLVELREINRERRKKIGRAFKEMAQAAE